MNARILILVLPLFFGAALGASGAPHKGKPAKPVAASASVAAEGPFRDVPPGHWAARSVETLRRAGIVRGYPSVKK